MRTLLIDGAAALVVLGLAFAMGAAFAPRLVAAGFQGEFYQSEFGPAVLMACAQGYRNPDEQQLPALRAFLNRQTDRLDCSALPEVIPEQPLSGPQATWKYLLLAVAATWWLAGVSWSAVHWLSAFLLGLTAVSAYAALRLASGRVVSIVGALLVISSPLHVLHVLQLRDYVKAPFMITIALLLVVLVTRRLPLASLLGWSLAVGVVLGVGMGFRNDLLIAVPAFVVAVTFASFRVPGRLPLRLVAGLGIGAAGSLVAAAPVMGAYAPGGGAGMSHVALLGMAAPFDQALGIAPSSIYRFGHPYNDSGVAAVISDEAFRREGHHQPIATYDAAYDRASTALVRSVFENLPADLWIRGLASTIAVLQLPSSSALDSEVLPLSLNRWIATAYDVRARLVRGRGSIVMFVVILAFIAGAATSPAPTLVLLLLTVYFAAYPAVQFAERHYFHLNLIPIAAAAYLASAVWRTAAGVASGKAAPVTARVAARGARNVAIVLLSAALVIVAPLPLLRAYEDRQVLALVERATTMPRVELSPADRPTAAGKTSLGLDDLPATTRSAQYPQTTQAEYLRAEIGGNRCDAALVRIAIDYESTEGMAGFQRQLNIATPPPLGAATLVFFPVYYYQSKPGGSAVSTDRYLFQALTLADSERACVTSVSRVLDPSPLPLLLDLTLPPEWSAATRHQTLLGWEESRSADPRRIYAPDGQRTILRSELSSAATPIGVDALAQHAGTFSMNALGHIAVRGAGGIGGAGRATYLATFKPGRLRRGQRLVAEGTLRRGGLSIGLVSRGKWATQVSVGLPGVFVLVVEAPDDLPDAVVVVANSLSSSSLYNEFEITRFGWIP